MITINSDKMKYYIPLSNTTCNQSNITFYFTTSAKSNTLLMPELDKKNLNIQDIEKLFKKDTFLESIYREVESHLGKEIFTIPYLASLLFTTRSTLYREVKKKTGRSVITLVKIVRLLKADILLKTSDRSISDIAYQVGFKAPSHFTTSYKKEFGYSPKEARNLFDNKGR